MNLVLAYAALEKLEKGISYVLKAKGLLLPDRAKAGQELALALDEIVKTFLAVDRAIGNYMALAVAPAGLQNDVTGLTDVQGGSLEVQVANEIGHCHKIGEVYYAHLKPWFQHLLGTTDALMLQNLFEEWSSADVDLFQDLGHVAGMLRTEAGQVLDLIMANDQAAASARLRSSYGELRDLSGQLRQATLGLIKLRDEFRGWDG
jgi:hypothetical protein